MAKPTDFLIEGLKPRLTDPYISTYLISFLFYNYQIFIFSFSDLAPQEKVKFINDSISAYGFRGIWLPILITPIVLILIPKLLIFIKGYTILENNRTDLKNLMFKAEERLLPFETKLNSLNQKINEIENQLKDHRDTSSKDVSKKDQLIGRLEQQNTELKNTLTEYTKKQDSPQNISDLLRTYSRLSESDITQTLKHFELDVSLPLNVRQFAEANSLAPNDSIDVYIDDVTKIITDIYTANSSSATVKQNYSNFLTSLNQKNYRSAVNYALQMHNGKTITSTETKGIIIAVRYLASILDYLA